MSAGKKGRYQVLEENHSIQTRKDTATCCLRPYQRCLLVASLCLLILIVIGLAVALVFTLSPSSNKAGGNTPSPTPPPSNGCPIDPPNGSLPCPYTREGDCTTFGCCWYKNTTSCLLVPSCNHDSNSLFSCLPEGDGWSYDKSEEVCHSRGCCWQPNATIRCSYSSNHGYRLDGKLQDGPFGVMATLVRKESFPSMFGGDSKRLKVDVTYETDYRLRVKIYDESQSDRYQVPLNLTSKVFGQTQTKKPSNMMYSFSLTESESFGFEIKRTSSQATLFKMAPGLVVSDQFLQISSHLPSSYIYGLGEHATPWRLDMNYSKLTLFSRDVPPDPVFDTTRNLYGVHPMYLCMDNITGSAHGVFLLNSNAMEIELLPYPAITYRTIGGVLDFYFLLGPSPDDVISQYTQLIGRPFLPPYWSLGFHLCRWGYFSSERTLEVVERMRHYGIPQDTQWNDIDYMSDHLDFTYNHTSYATMPQLVDNLHAHGQHYVVITDPGISATKPAGTYPPYDDGLDDRIFIMNETGSGPLLGMVWPGITAYPDFTNPATESYWLEALTQFHDNISFDGLWIDMNEPSNFIPGSIYGCSNSTLNNPPYLPVAIRAQGSILDKTLCMTGVQYLSSHYNVHSLYGHTEAIETMRSLQSLFNKRSLVISRSTYPGSGVYTGHWLGDNASQWPHLRQSIPGILNFALFGIPLVGADICGFFDNTTSQLCMRWQQVGAFYPFSRNHNSYNTIAQDPTEFGEEVINSTRNVLLIRYKLLPFLYTLFYHAHTNGSMVATPLLSVFPSDTETWSNARQFMWGKALLISPVLEENATSVVAYFPKGRWFDYRNGTEFVSKGQYVVILEAPLDYIPLHVLGGSIIPQQEPNTTTTLSKQNPYSLLVSLNATGESYGSLFIDDGEELDSIENGHYTLLAFHVEKGQLSSIVLSGGYSAAVNCTMNEVTVYGLSQEPAGVTGDDVIDWNWTNNVLFINVNVTNLNKPFTLNWS
ncbi:PREDICTED: lysosomal alpha-glucosidase-like [Amphimedon queenslandica]|uniref:P-type domain-containing protein n=1 Tax=Amphimedon queenslandica TaxID=400682 RepID=A0A1X7UKX4_AMPQE|nr:PREDICTED: lysosomal alpha-glucosidase-like [Amphimedon queenslandica]|eukprot:XP_019853735.1 PREDICTED: lysosomal alpha-glucosidase-like [Amphimedon queenslandica]